MGYGSNQFNVQSPTASPGDETAASAASVTPPVTTPFEDDDFLAALLTFVVDFNDLSPRPAVFFGGGGAGASGGGVGTAPPCIGATGRRDAAALAVIGLVRCSPPRMVLGELVELPVCSAAGCI
jgi:hypothetical protein